MIRPLLLSCTFVAIFGTVLNSATCSADVDFQKSIRPILAENCWHCHGADEAARRGNLRLDHREGALAKGESGRPAIIPGQPEASELLRRVTSHDPDELMPPPDQPRRPTAADIELLRQWIAEGAAWEEHWAFTAPQKAQLPDPVHANPIDSFVSHRLQQEGLSFTAEAPSEQLIRRLFLDLIGLPPSPQQLRQYLAEGPDAATQMLLQSPRFGEKWTRHWLDLARYSDTNGYEKDLQR